MSRRLLLEVKDANAFVRDLSSVVFVPGPSNVHLGERVVLDAVFANGARAAVRMKVLGARHFASRALDCGVFLVAADANDADLVVARDVARAAAAARNVARVEFASRAAAVDELRGLLDPVGAVLMTGTAHRRGDRLDVDVVVDGAVIATVAVLVKRVHVQDMVSGVVATAVDEAAVSVLVGPVAVEAVDVDVAVEAAVEAAPVVVEAPAPRTEVVVTHPPRALRVLIVDDDRDFVWLTSKVLERRGHVVVGAADANDVVARVAAVAPDVVVLDRGLPGVTGDQALALLAADPRTRAVPVLLASAGSVGLDVDRAAQHPCCRTLLKSGRASETVAAIEATAASVALSSSSPPRAEPTLLLAEDDVDVREEATAWLESAGFTINAANDGGEAIRALVGGLKPDAIVLDLMMPVLSGWAVYEWLRASPHARVPVIIWTAAGAAVGTDTLRDARVVEKGKNPQILLDTIRASTTWARAQA